jgi:hypothetical protein
MQIELYSITWNERRMLPFFLDYYGPWVERFAIFDDQSDDGTAETLARYPKVHLQPSHSASRSPLAQLGARTQGNGFARSLLGGHRERPLWRTRRYDRLWPVAGIDAIRSSGC